MVDCPTTRPPGRGRGRCGGADMGESAASPAPSRFDISSCSPLSRFVLLLGQGKHAGRTVQPTVLLTQHLCPAPLCRSCFLSSPALLNTSPAPSRSWTRSRQTCGAGWRRTQRPDDTRLALAGSARVKPVGQPRHPHARNLRAGCALLWGQPSGGGRVVQGQDWGTFARRAGGQQARGRPAWRPWQEHCTRQTAHGLHTTDLHAACGRPGFATMGPGVCDFSGPLQTSLGSGHMDSGPAAHNLRGLVELWAAGAPAVRGLPLIGLLEARLASSARRPSAHQVPRRPREGKAA
jgi:hypothetical protein